MAKRFMNILVGILLVLAGALFLAQNAGWIAEFSVNFWIVILAGLSTSSSAAMPPADGEIEACSSRPVSWWVATTIAMAEAGMDGSIVAAPILLGSALPFLAAYLLDRKASWWALIPVWALLVVTLILVIVEGVPGEVIGSLVLLAIAIPFLVIYILDRSRRWALIPAFLLAAIGFIPLISTAVSGEIIRHT
jgi:hypothetical protein